MDQFMVDVTDIPKVRVGDEVTLIGTDGSETLSMNELGELSERFNYEFACDLGKRIPRVFTQTEKLSIPKIILMNKILRIKIRIHSKNLGNTYCKSKFWSERYGNS